MSSAQKDKLVAARNIAAKYAFWLSIVICLCAGLYLSLSDDSLTLMESISGIGVNLIAAAVFASIFAFLSDRENRNLVRAEIAASFSDNADKLANERSAEGDLYLPDSVYPPTQGFDGTFNGDLMSTFERTSTYYFRGASAKYVPARIKAAKRCPHNIKVFIPGSTATSAVRMRVSDRLKNPKYAGISPDELFSSLREEMISSFVGLFDCRAYSLIEVGFCADTSVIRMEMTEEQLFVSWYHSPASSKRSFPQTYQFLPKSLYYQISSLDLSRRMNISDQVVRLDQNMHDEEFCAIMSKTFGKEFTTSDISRYRDQYWASMGDFMKFLESLH